MRKQFVTLALAGTLGLTGAALLSPTLANATTGTPSPAGAVADRLSALQQALSGLVTDKTLTQAQADEVAATLADRLPTGPRGDGPGGRGRHGARVSPEDTAAVLGITVEQLRTQREAGKSLAQIAATKGISRADLVEGLVAKAEAQLEADVTAGRLTQAQADAARSALSARTTARVDRVGGPGGGGGPHGHSDGDGDGDGDGGPAAPSPGATPPAPSSTPASPSGLTTTGATVGA